MRLKLKQSDLVSGAAKADSFRYYGMRSGPVEVIDTAGQGRRQFASANGLTDVVDNFTGGDYVNTEVRLYRETGTKVGGFYPGANLIKTIRFEHAALPGGADQLTVSDMDGIDTRTTTYVHDAAGAWTLVTAEGKRRESQVETVNGSTRTVTSEIRAADNTLLEKVRRIFTTYAWGEELTQVVSDPDGETRTATWAYETGAGANGYTKLVSMVDADGYWERYTHHPDGRREKVISQYMGAAVGAGESASRVVTTSYDGENRTEVESLLGQEVARRYVLRTDAGAVTTERVQVCTVAGAAVNAISNLETTTVYRADGSDVTHPDGTLMKTTTSADGLTTTTESGATSGGAVTDGTRTVVRRDARGNEAERSVYDVATGTLVRHDLATVVDEFGRPRTVTHLDGTSESRTYGCCASESWGDWTDVEGITTVYGYDDFGNVASETRAGITLDRTYDALGRLRLLTRTGSDAVPVTIGGSDYDLAGHETLRRGILGNITVDKSPGAGNTWTRTETLPGGATRIRKSSSDGLLLEVGGTAEHPRTFGYEVSGGLRSVKETRIGENGAAGEWTRTALDAAGRVKTVSYPDGAQASSEYNPFGQLVRQIDPDGVATLFDYNARGERTTVALDVNRDSVPGAGDPWVTTERSVAGGNLRTTTTRAGDAGPVTVAVIDQDIDSLNRVETHHGLATTIAITAGSGTRTEVATLPDQSTRTMTYVNGRLAGDVHAGGGSTARSLGYDYDARGRLWHVIDARSGTTTLAWYDTDLLHTVSKGSQITSYDYNALGQRTTEALPGGRTIIRDYRPTGELISISGNAAHPVTYGHDPQGRRTSMTTTSGTTTWQYHPQRGWLEFKKDATQKAVNHTYTDAGRPETRTWARGVTTTWGYDDGGRLDSITYSDGTPAVTFDDFNAQGLPWQVRDAAGTHALAYTVDGALDSETITGGALDGVTLDPAYDGLRRRSGFAASRGGTSLAAYGWGYDALSRLGSVTSGSDTAAYAYHPNSAFIHTITARRGGATRLTTTRLYDDLDRIESNVSVPASGPASGAIYEYNSAGLRETATLPDDTYWFLGYNARGEVETAVKKLDDGTPMAGWQFGYTFDGIGNRLSATASARTATYTPTAQNQYAARTVPGYATVLGTALPAASVSVNGQAADRQPGGFFHKELAASNTSAPVWLATSVTATLGSEIATLSGHLFVPASPEAFQYDLDGNMLRDGRWNYAWDAENRLASMVTRADVAAVGAPRQRLSFGYDWLGRRFSKKVEDWHDDAFRERFTLLFAYDGWNLAAEWVQGGGGIPIRSYAWGADLSGGDAAGGVGGLLFINQLPEGKTFAPGTDGNGNVTALYDMADGSLAGTYEYGPFGEPIRVTGQWARINPMRWSTKYTDVESDLLYYIHRYYKAELGRWLNHDPIEEEGGVNLYGFVGNDPVNLIDPWGLFESPGWMRAIIPGQIAWDNAVTSWEQGNYATATSYVSLMVAEQILTIWTFGESSTLMQGGRAANCVVAAKASTLELNTATTWGKAETLADHFARHGADVGAKTADEYANIASRFLQESQAAKLPTKIDSQGVIRVFDPKTGTFGSFNPNGTTRTLFNPNSATYFDRQPGTLLP